MTARKDILAHLREVHPAPVVPADLAVLIGVTPGWAARLVDRMVLAGELTSTPLGVVIGEGAPSGPRTTAPTLRLRQDVVDILGDGPLGLTRIAERLRVRPRHARRVLTDMKRLGLVDREQVGPSSVLWRLP